MIRLQKRTAGWPSRLVALGVAAAVAMSMNVAPVAAAEKPLNRPNVMERAKYWAKQGVPYSQAGYRGGYRRDCSGFVSYAWDLPENLVTWNIPLVAKPIGKNSLMRGDVLLNAKGGVGGRHVVLFEKWANAQKTAYIGIEQTGQNGVNKTVRRVLPYPYKFDKGLYKPYRYVGMDNYYKKIPKGQRQSVRGYKGRVQTPEQLAAAKAAAAKAAAVKAAADKAAAQKAAAEEAAKQAAEQAAAAQAAADEAAAEKAAAEKAAAEEAAKPAVMRLARQSANLILGVLATSIENGRVGH